MTNNKPSLRYSHWSIALHWLMAALLVATVTTIELKGIYPKGSAGRDLLKSVHFSLGLSVFGLLGLRLLARALGPTPPITPEPPAWQAMLGELMHLALYALMICLPVLGWLALSAKGTPVTLLGGLALPLLPFAIDKETAALIKDFHQTGATVGYVLVGLHAAAALVHHYLQRDNTLLRILPGAR